MKLRRFRGTVRKNLNFDFSTFTFFLLKERVKIDYSTTSAFFDGTNQSRCFPRIQNCFSSVYIKVIVNLCITIAWMGASVDNVDNVRSTLMFVTSFSGSISSSLFIVFVKIFEGSFFHLFEGTVCC